MCRRFVSLPRAEGSQVFVICAQIEQEIAELDDDEKKMFLEDLGLKESGLEKLIAASYDLLGLISYLTSQASTRPAHGQSVRPERKRPRLPVRSTAISSAASSGPRW